ncbi:MAG: hypothetical protein ACI81I_000476, partial [Arcobacteraceae bacterium]
MNYISWLYFLVENHQKENEKVLFLYGLSLPTSKKVNKTKIESKVLNSKKLIIKFITISQNLINFDNDLIDFTGFIMEEKYTTNIIYKKDIIQVASDINLDIPNSLLTTPIYTKCFYTEDFYQYYNELQSTNSGIESLVKILDILQQMSGQKFSNSYSKRLGCYETSTAQIWCENVLTPFIVNSKHKNSLSEYYFNVVDNSYNFDSLTVHLIIYNNENEILCDIIKVLNSLSYTFLAEVDKESEASYEYWIFNYEGKLI